MGSKKKSDYAALRDLFRPHIESFDYFVEQGLEKALQSIRPIKIFDDRSDVGLIVSVGNSDLQKPYKDSRVNDPLYPLESRLAKLTYKGEFKAVLSFKYEEGNKDVVIREDINFGHLPIMLMSKLCHLRGADSQKLIYHKEEATEMGGYFICNGLERLCRLTIIQKSNHPMSMVRKSFQSRGPGFSDKAVVIRCVREDQSSLTVKLYYLQNGSARLGFWIQGREFLLPVGIILKALVDSNDREIFVSLTCYYNDAYEREKGAVGSQLIGERAQIVLDEARDLSLFTHSQCLEHIGEYFKPIMDGFESADHRTVAEAVMKDCVFVHLTSNHDKFNLLIFMLQKLYSLVDQTSAPDNADALQNHEVLLPGHLLSIYVKERVQEWLNKSRRHILEELEKKDKCFDLKKLDQVKKFFTRSSALIGRSVEGMIKTGTLSTRSGLDLPQRAGLTIIAERLNFLRFISHFRSVHRGNSFAKMRLTTVRKLLPESWGFLCPVHTPDGEPCGLLNHMTAACRIASYYDVRGEIKDFKKIRMSLLSVLVGIGMTPAVPKLERAGPPEVLPVMLDGSIVGSIASGRVEKAVAHIRLLKLSRLSGIPDDLEVGYVPLSLGGSYPGLYLFTNPSRFLRPVKNICQTADDSSNIELIGPFEQAFMEIRCQDGGDGGRRESFPSTHEEIHPTNILSVVANLTPWSDHNQSPRNMYQCQMAKQTMAFSSQSLKYRADGKMYHLLTPQSPIVRTATYNKYCIDEFPNGTNAIVAVLAYTGYDMEDAMILNKSSTDRGMFRGQIFQTESIDLTKTKHDDGEKIFAGSNDKDDKRFIGPDGLPHVGQMILPDKPFYSSYNTLTSITKSTKLKGSEAAYVDYVAVDGTNSKKYMQKVNIRTRRPRNPIIGDKFSSRHGQKGVCSQLWPDIDMPFSASTGMRPDLIINPHAFPSRMTIAMLLESIAAKGGSFQGKFVDATPFSSSVRDRNGDEPSKSGSIVDELGPMLTSCGFNYHGTEVLYSGIYGTELTCEIFMGPVYYQRLRHMVSDKFQVRSTGPTEQLTRQPIGGRKRGGGIRFGEMERDSILAHGAAYLLHDRLHSSSDYYMADVCSNCGSMLAASFTQPQKKALPSIQGLPQGRPPKRPTCLACKTSKGMEMVAMPFVFKYLASELATANIKLELRLSNRKG